MCSQSRYRSTGQQVVPAVGAQTLPERITAASNKAANTSSLSIVSIGLPRSLLKSSLSADSPGGGAPQAGANPPRMGTGPAAP